MIKFSDARLESHADLTQGLRIRQLAEKHGHELLPTGEPFGVLVAPEFIHILSEFTLVDQCEHLTEDAGCAIHRSDSFGL